MTDEFREMCRKLKIDSLLGRLVLTVLFSGAFLLRVPDILVRPQFWAEDGQVFFEQAFCFGAHTLIKTYAGYFLLVPRLTAYLSSFFRPVYAPALYCGAAVCLVALVLFLIMSPRLPLPFKPLLALSVVMTPHGEEVIANITNIQWYLHIAVLAVILMKPSSAGVTRFLEVVFIAVAGLTGPFMLLLMPVFAAKVWRDRSSRPARRRMVFLAGVAVITAAVQLAALVTSGPEAFGTASAPSSGLVDKIPMMAKVTVVHFASPFLQGIVRLGAFNTMMVWAIVILILTVLIVSLLTSEFRFEKSVIIYFMSVVLLTGLYKSREIIDQLIYPQNASRYFFIPNIMLAWLLIIALRHAKIRIISVTMIVLLSFSVLTDYRRKPPIDFDWPFWADKIRGDVPMRIPINPPGWFIDTGCSSTE